MMSDVKVSKKNHKLTEIISKIAAHILTVKKRNEKNGNIFHAYVCQT